MGMSYQQRKEQGELRRWIYKRRLWNAEYIATMLRGITLASAFCAVMFAIAGITTTLDVVIEIGVIALGGFTINLAEHILFWAEQSRYPKSRRRTLRSEIADEIYTWKQTRKEKKSSN